MSDEKKLSERVRPDVEAAPWVIDEIATLKKRLAEATKFIQDIADGGGFTGAAAKDFLENTHD